MGGGLNTLYRVKAAGGGGFANTKSITAGVDGTPNKKALFGNDETVSPSSQRIFTYSFWLKVAEGANQVSNIFPLTAGYGSSDLSVARFITFAPVNGDVSFVLNDVFGGGPYTAFAGADVLGSSTDFINFLVQVDTTQATAANRVHIYLDGVEITYDGGSTYPPQNYDIIHFNDATAFVQEFVTAGGNIDGLTTRYDEVAYFDGQTYGYTDVSSGGLPKDLSGLTFGNVGFWFRFETGAAASITTDSSGNGNALGLTNGGTGSAETYGAFVDGDFSTDVPA